MSLCGCVRTSVTPVEPAPVSEPAPAIDEPSPSFDARPLDPEIAALLAPEALAAAAETAEPKPPDPRTPRERAREACERRCAQAFSRDPMVHRIIDASRRTNQIEDPHGPPPELSDEDGLRRFVNGEPSTIWLLDGDPSGQGWTVAVYINPELTRAKYPFHGLLFEIDADDRVLRCRYAERNHPDAAVEMACPR